MNNKSMLDLIDNLDGMEIVYMNYESGYVTAWNGSSSFYIYDISDNCWEMINMFVHYDCKDSKHAKMIAIDHKKMMDEIENEDNEVAQ